MTETDRYNLCLVCRNKYKILFPNFFKSKQNYRISNMFGKIERSYKRTGGNKEKSEEKVGRQLLLRMNNGF